MCIVKTKILKTHLYIYLSRYSELAPRSWDLQSGFTKVSLGYKNYQSFSKGLRWFGGNKT